MPNPETYNLRQLINNHFFDRDQTKEILENFVTVDNNSVLHVGLPEPTSVALTTPNNAITTADVGTLKAKVTGANSVNCYGVPVDFVNRKTREVIGQGITDLNGEAYYNFRLEDSDIFSVQAKLSQDYLFHDGAILNNTASWGDLGNIVQEIYHDYTLIYKDDDSLDSLLYSPTLSGYTEISFKAKLVDAAAGDSFCGLIETNSSGTVTGNLNGVTLSQLGLTAASNGQWFKFYINVLGTDVLIKAVNIATGAVSTANVTLSSAMSYFSFCFVLTGDLTSTYFTDVKINKCSDDLTMFVKDKNKEYFYYDLAVTGNKNTSYYASNGVSVETPTYNGTELTYSSQYAEYKICEIGSTTHQYLIPIPFCVEFDVVSMTSNVLMVFYQNSPYVIQYMVYGSSSISEETHIKFEVKNNKLYRTINGNTSSLDFNYTADKLRIAFQSRQATGTLKFKNLVIYKI